MACESGTQLRRSHIPSSDAPLVSRLKNAGAIILGNTTVPEFLMAWETHSALYGRTNSPWDPDGRREVPAAANLRPLRRVVRREESAAMEADRYASPHISAASAGLSPLRVEFLQPDTFRLRPDHLRCWEWLVRWHARFADLQLMFQVIAGPDNGDPMPRRCRCGRWTLPRCVKRALVISKTTDELRLPAETRRGNPAFAQIACAMPDLLWNLSGLRDSKKLAGYGGSCLWTAAPCSCVRRTRAGNRKCIPSFAKSSKLPRKDPPFTAESLFETLFGRDLLRARFLDQMDTVIRSSLSCFRGSRFSPWRTLVDSRRQKVNIWTPSATRSGLTFSGIPGLWCRWTVRRRVADRCADRRTAVGRRARSRSRCRARTSRWMDSRRQNY